MEIFFIGNFSFFQLDLRSEALRIYYRNRRMSEQLMRLMVAGRLAFQRERANASDAKRDLTEGSAAECLCPVSGKALSGSMSGLHHLDLNVRAP